MCVCVYISFLCDHPAPFFSLYLVILTSYLSPWVSFMSYLLIRCHLPSSSLVLSSSLQGWSIYARITFTSWKLFTLSSLVWLNGEWVISVEKEYSKRSSRAFPTNWLIYSYLQGSSDRVNFSFKESDIFKMTSGSSHVIQTKWPNAFYTAF